MLKTLTFQCLVISASWLRERRAAEALSTSCIYQICFIQHTVVSNSLSLPGSYNMLRTAVQKVSRAYLGGHLHRCLPGHFSNLQKTHTVKMWKANLRPLAYWPCG